MMVRWVVLVLCTLLGVALAACDRGPSAPASRAEPAAEAPAAMPRSEAPEPPADLKPVHFDFDRARIRPQDAGLLDEHARWLKSRPEVVLEIGGHADQRGPLCALPRRGAPSASLAGTPLASGDGFLLAVREALTRRGVEARRLAIAGYGEQRPVCMEHDEACWAKNRRAEFQVRTQ